MDDLSTLSGFEDNDGSVAASGTGQQAPDEESRVRGFEFLNPVPDQFKEVTDRPGDRPETSDITENEKDGIPFNHQVSEARLGLKGPPKARSGRAGRPSRVPRPQRRLPTLLPKPISASKPISAWQEDIQKRADVFLQDLFPRIPNKDRQAILEHTFFIVSLSLPNTFLFILMVI